MREYEPATSNSTRLRVVVDYVTGGKGRGGVAVKIRGCCTGADDRGCTGVTGGGGATGRVTLRLGGGKVGAMEGNVLQKVVTWAAWGLQIFIPEVVCWRH